MIGNLIFSFIRDQVDDLIGQGTKQIDRMQDEVLNGLRQSLNPLEGGGWSGQGADKFFTEMSQVVVPEIMSVATGGFDFFGAFGQIANMMEQADEGISGLLGGIGDMFDSIF